MSSASAARDLEPGEALPRTRRRERWAEFEPGLLDTTITTALSGIGR